ncbi:MAG: hypothetical protein J6S67_01115 [Methanobrevibacter sp.]|nr:hypothetical protein [Methanobrevibacter sp.]
MIEVEYVYIRKDGKVLKGYAHFFKADKALRFIYKLNSSKNMVFTGDYSCTDPLDFEYISRRLK